MKAWINMPKAFTKLTATVQNTQKRQNEAMES